MPEQGHLKFCHLVESLAEGQTLRQDYSPREGLSKRAAGALLAEGSAAGAEGDEIRIVRSVVYLRDMQAHCKLDKALGADAARLNECEYLVTVLFRDIVSCKLRLVVYRVEAGRCSEGRIVLSFALFFEQLGAVNSGIERIAVLEEKLSIELLFLFHLLFVRDYGELFSYRLFVFAERTRHGLAVLEMVIDRKQIGEEHKYRGGIHAQMGDVDIYSVSAVEGVEEDDAEVLAL